MCGIAGEISFAEPPSETGVRRVLEDMIHRGPDAEGVWGDGRALLGHRRLAILDPTARADQPMHDSSGRYVIVFNGEIYNFRALRDELEAHGDTFLTTSDTEVLLAAYRRWGEGCLESLNGMFAFVIWDRVGQTLFAARDRFGEKPFFYRQLPDGGLIFASELSALAQHPRLERRIDPVSLGRYLSCGYTLGEQTFLEGVERLPPASFLIARRGHAPRIGRYWDLAQRIVETPRETDFDTAREAFDALLRDSVDMRLVSDVPLGAFISGGIDSSLIVSEMASLGDPGAVKCFAMGFHEPSYSELPKARSVAHSLGVDLFEEIVTANNADGILATLEKNDEPFADSSIIPTHNLAAFTRRHVTVALSGDGGDELFAGYETYRANHLRSRVSATPKYVLAAARRGAERLLPVSWNKIGFDYKLRQFLSGASLDFAAAHWHWRTLFGPDARWRLLGDGWKHVAAYDGLDVVLKHDAEVAHCSELQRAAYIDIKTWLTDDVLVKVDRATMSHSLESRAPFLDHRLAEFALALPDVYKLRGAENKRILRESVARRLPSDIVKQKKKGFNAPVAHWMAGPLREPLLDTVRSEACKSVLEPAEVERLLHEHVARKADHGFRLFALLALGVWLTGGRAAAAPSTKKRELAFEQ